MVLGSHYDAILSSEKPKLFIMGGEDGFTSVSQLEARLKATKNAKMVIIPGVGHFALETPKYAAETSRHIVSFIESIKV